MDILQGNGYAFSAYAASDFLVYPGVFSSPACVSKPSDFPVSHVAPDNLRVTGQDVKGNFRLRRVKFRYKV